ncbi:MAG: Ig-like domain-containing protein [Lentibacter sp.]|uniref:Ig-like domain-containing protein n=1 Tax=Lentibacter sp. TaxID=2024994 RepID=UPI0026023047|nr:Ig-like domain-containing protein [Lentibacter sp.]MDG1290399.1 Ig-like domain-containing protein [Lentibacter sp.]
MADLVLNWGLLGAFGTNVEPTQTVDTGGINVTIGFDAQDEEASGVTFNAPGYVAETDPFDSKSFLKLSGQGGEGGVDATSTTTLDFTSSNALFEDCVQNVTFRLNDIDGGGNDIDPTSLLHEDIVTIRAYGPDGNELPVTFTTGSNVTATGNTLSDGDTNFGYEDAKASTLVSVAGPVTRIEIEYANGNVGEQTVMVSDLHFSTCPADGNDAPVLVDDSALTDEDTAVVVDVLGNDSDPEGDPLTVTDTTAPANSSVMINADGTVTYTPNTGFIGTDSFEYTVTDGQGNLSTVTVTVTVADPADNLPAMLVDDAAETDEDTAVVIDVLGNDSDPEGDALTVTDTTEPANGSVVINADGTVTYTPDAGFTGEDTFEYSVEDEGGNISTATVTVTVGDTGPNAPATPMDDMATTDEDTPVVINVLSNDTDPEGDVLTVVDASEPANGTVVINPDGTVTYTPSAGFTGQDTFEYTVEDAGGNYSSAVVFVQVGEGDLPPVATDDADTTDVDTPLVITVLGNDSDPEGEALTVTGTTEPLNGSVAINADGTVTYTPDTGFTGTDTFDYTITDPAGNASTATVTVMVQDPSMPEGIVSGTPNDDLIDTGYTGDPDGDLIDANDQIIPGEDVNDDIVRAGDGADTVLAGDGDDDVQGGTGDDDLSGEAGDDSLFGQEGNDIILGGQGNDTITGGDGADTVDGGSEDDVIDTSGGTPLTDDVDPDPEDDRDSVIGGTGNDIITTGDDDDTVLGGAGNDVIDAGIDDDLVDAGDGNDSVIAGQGNDTVVAGAGDDTVDGGAGDDSIIGGTGNDSIIGGEGDDTAIGALGNDTLIGGDGDDFLDGVVGDDLMSGGAGADTMLGGQGQDTFIDITGGDVVDGGSGPAGVRPDGTPNDFDTLDLTGAAEAENPGGTLNVTYTSADREDGFVEFRDADGNITSTMVFEEIENVVPCFTPGTAIATPRGERLVEDLQVGDKIITRDNGIQEIRWMGQNTLSGHELARSPNLRPILIQKGALGNNLPEYDILVSPQHRILINNERTSLYFEETEVLAAAKHLTELKGVDEVGTLGVTYVHFMFDNHEVVLSNGAWTESFQPGQSVIDGLGTEQRDEIFQLFPELKIEKGIKDYTAARRALKKHEAKLLVR